VFELRPDDPKAVYVSVSNSEADQSYTLQAAIDHLQETTHHGVVFVAEGHYRIEHTVHVWAGIRLIGYGAHRPVFVLPPHSSDFESGPHHYMLWYTDERTAAAQPIADASEFTFYSGLSNIDFELGDGNPAAVAIRFNVAQHSFITHSDLKIGSAEAALEAIGNQASDIHVHGGRSGIITGKTSPAWQFLLIDSSFDGQRETAISTHEAGFTLIRDRISNTSVAMEIPDGTVEQLYARDLQLDHISKLALAPGDIHNLRNEITLANIACSDVPHFAPGLEVNSRHYVEEQYTQGLYIGGDGREQGIEFHHRERTLAGAAAAMPSDIPVLPPMKEWVNVRTLGVKGDGGSDDTASVQQAIDQHRVLYFPGGMYRLTGSLRLRPDSVLIGFSPFTTQFTIVDADPQFQGKGAPIPLLIAPSGGATIVTGFGISTGNLNPCAAGIEWLAGAHSFLDDTEFIRSHNEAGRFFGPAMPPPQRGVPVQVDAQYPSLWIHDGGGGIFRDLWSHAGTAKAGVVVENTNTPGVFYQLSNEHHMQHEVRFERAANWTVYDLQTEEERPEGAEAVALEVVNSHDLVFVNTYMYRVSRNILPKLYAAMGDHAANVVFANVKVFSQTRLSFDNSLVDVASGVHVRAHHFVRFVLSNDLAQGTTLPLAPVFAKGAELQRVATGFSNASGLTADPLTGTIYFTDSAMHSVYKFADLTAKLLAHTEQMPQAVGFVAPNSLLAVNWERSVSLVDTRRGQVAPVRETETAPPGTVLLLPVGLHNEEMQLQWMLQHVGYKYRVGSNTATRSDLTAEHRGYYFAPDNKTALMGGEPDKPYAAWRWRPLPESCQLLALPVGASHPIISEDDEKTYEGIMTAPEKLSADMIVERGGTSVVMDTAGNLYLASGQIFIYNKQREQIGILEVPERPSSLAWGGADGKTLFIGARSSVYAIRTVNPGARPQ
jgi:hypothetical protein